MGSRAFRGPAQHSSVDVVLPALNEVEALPWVLGRMPPGFRPIVVDNASTDGTAVVAAHLGAMVVSEPRRGFGAAAFAGLVAARTDVVCFMDCDASCDPADLPRLVGRVEAGRADLVLGRRVPQPGAWPPHARLANRLLAGVVGVRTGVGLRDLGPMRAARREALLSLQIRDRGFGWPLEMVLRAIRSGWRVEERDVAYLARAGRSKVTGTPTGTVRAVRDMGRVLAEHRA